MGKGNAAMKRARSGPSGKTTPEARLVEVATPTDDKSDHSSQEDDADQDDARRSGNKCSVCSKPASATALDVCPLICSFLE